MTTRTHPYRREITSLLNTVQSHGLELYAVNDGEEIVRVDGLREALEAILAVDESTLVVATEDRRLLGLYVVLGNGPGEAVCDYSDHPTIDAAVTEHYDRFGF